MFKLNDYHLETTLFRPNIIHNLYKFAFSISKFHFCFVSIYNYSLLKFNWKPSECFSELCELKVEVPLIN